MYEKGPSTAAKLATYDTASRLTNANGDILARRSLGPFCVATIIAHMC
jgi:hypothetical protein